jgi:hypothetical protein
MLNAWVTPFSRSVWLGLVITYLLLSVTVGAQLQAGKICGNKASPDDYTVPFITVAGLFLRQEGANVECQSLLTLTSLFIGIILSQYENYVTSELVVPPPKFEHNLSSLMMSAGVKLIYSGSEIAINADPIELQTQLRKWSITYSKEQLELNNGLYRLGLPLFNGTRLAYFGYYSAAEIDLRLRFLKLVNNKCYCYIVKHTFRPRETYITFELFLRNRFASIANVLRQSGIIQLFSESFYNYEIARGRIQLRRRLEKSANHLDFFVSEGPRLAEIIKLENLHFIFVLFGGMVFVAVNTFMLEQVNWLSLWDNCKHSIRSGNCFSLTTDFSLLSLKIEAQAIRNTIKKIFSWMNL